MLHMMNKVSPFQKLSEQVLFCDFDGPIVDVSERYYRTYRLGLSTLQASYQEDYGEALCLNILSKNQFWWMKRNRVADNDIALRSGISADLVDTFLSQVQRIVNHPYLLQWDALQPGAQLALHQLKNTGLRLILVTLRHQRQVKDFLHAHALNQYVDEIFGAADINSAHLNRTEQKVELLERAITAQKTRGYQVYPTCMIGDTEADIIAGQRAEISTVALTNGIRSRTYLERYHPTSIEPNLLKAVQGQHMTQVLQAA